MRGLRVKGKDAEDFLHRLSAGSVRGLSPGEGSRGLLLTGQSRMIAQFDLLRLKSEEFLLVAPEGIEALQQGLERLHFAEELEIEAGESFHLIAGKSQGEKRFKIEGLSWPSPVPGFEVRPGEGPLPRDFHFQRIGALVPWPGDWSENTPALEAAGLFAIDRNKGCYPGQEVVELSLNVGHPARVLVSVEGPLDPGLRIPLEGGGEGVVTSTAEQDGLYRAMVRVPWAKKAAVPGFRILKGWELH